MRRIFNFQLSIFNFIKHPLFAGSAIMILGSNSASVINYLFHLLMGRLLGPSGYGELVALISLSGLLGILPGSIQLVITKQISSARNEGEINDLIGWFKKKIFFASLISMVIILILSPLMSSFLKIQDISYLILIAFSFMFSTQSMLNRSILQGLLRFKEMIFSILAENGTKLVLSILLVYLGLQVGGVMVALAISSLLGLFVTIFYMKAKYRATKEEGLIPDIKSMLLFAIPVGVQALATTSLYSSDVILVKHFFSSQDAGIYAALSMLGKIIFFGTGPIGTVMFPLVSQRKAKGEGYKKIFFYSFLITTMLSVSILIIYWLFPNFAIGLLYGKLYLEAPNILVWFGLFMSFFTLSTLLINYGLSLGRTSIVVLPLIAALAQVVLIYFFHQTLFIVILISTMVATLLLVGLLIYSIVGVYGKLRN